MTLILGENLLHDSLSMIEAIDLVEEAYRHEAAGQTISAPRQTTLTEKGWMRLMYAADYQAGYAAFKAFHLTRAVGVRYVVSLYRLEDGEFLAILDARESTDLRTGATSGVAARYMAPEGSQSLGILGSGHQAITQLEAMAAVLPLTSVAVYSPTPENRHAFAENMSEKLNLEVRAVDTPEEALQDQPVVVLATNITGPKPVLRSSWLSEPCLVCGVGSTRRESIEVDLDTIRRSDWVVMDTAHASEEAGDLGAALDEGILHPDEIWTLAQLLERKPGPLKEGFAVFKSVGSALQDLAVAVGYYERMKGNTMVIDAPGLASLKSRKKRT
jgi:alanine dehydrogenase